MTTQFSWTIDREPPLDVNVEGRYIRGWRGTRTDPPEYDNFEITSVTDETGEEVLTTEAEDAAIIEYALDNRD